MPRAHVSHGRSIQRRLSSLAPPPGVQRGYALATLIDSAGTGLFLTVSAVFFVRIVGLSAAQVGVGLSVAGIAGLVSAAPGGHLGDRYGYRRVLISLSLVRAPLFALYLLIHNFAAFLIVVSLITAAETASNPVRRAYLTTMVSPEQRVRITAYNRATFNVGISLGSLGAGVALGVNSWAIYAVIVLADSVSYLLSIVVLLRLPADRGTVSAKVVTSVASGRRSAVFKDRPFITLSILFGLLYIHAALFTVGIPLWVYKHTGAPKWVIAGVMLLNTVLAVAFQVRAARGTDTAAGAARAARRAGNAIFLGCLICAASTQAFPLLAAAELLVGAAFLTAGELLSSTASWGLSYELAPGDKQGLFLGVWSQGAQLAQVIAPTAVVLLVVDVGTLGWLILGVFFCITGFLAVPVTQWALRSRTGRESAAVETARRSKR